MTTSDLTPALWSQSRAPADTSPETAVHGIASLFDWGRTLTEAMTLAQEQGLAFLRRKHERDVEFMGALASAQNPMTAMGTVLDYLHASLTDMMTESTRRVLDLPQMAPPAPRAEMPRADAVETEQTGHLAGPLSPIPGPPDSAPEAASASSARGAAFGAKSRSTPI